jgi:hypothetical protein
MLDEYKYKAKRAAKQGGLYLFLFLLGGAVWALLGYITGT